MLVYKRLDNGTIDFSDCLPIEHHSVIPEGYVFINPNETNGDIPEKVTYKETGEEMTTEELEEIRNQPHEPTPIELLQQENADIAFNLMVVEGEAQTARQEVADLNFQLMINVVI